MNVVKSDVYRRWRIVFVGVVIALLLPVCVRATHIVGGDISMKAIGRTPGLFRVQLNQYWDVNFINNSRATFNIDSTVMLLVYRKNNPVLVDTINITIQDTVRLSYGNPTCAKIRNFNFVEAHYYIDYQFDPAKYTDPGGYYIAWERCCRNAALTNVANSMMAGVGIAFYLEFPAMKKNGNSFVNSAPAFRSPNGEYICINKPFTFNFDATDADGDQLRYSLVTPLNGYTSLLQTFGNKLPKASYPPIIWANGISLQNIIPGDPPLSINPTTGQLSVKATQEGLFLFSVECEEYRNGVRIGSVRRDFQLPVVDCSKATNPLPPPVITLNGLSIPKTFTWCATQPLVLTVENNPNYSYQWQRDGSNVRGAVSDTFQVKESGEYAVVRSQLNVCVNDTISTPTTVTFVTPPPVKISLAGNSTKPYCTGDVVTLQAQGQPDYVYQWQRDGNVLTGEQKATLVVSQTGKYTVRARPAAAECNGEDTVTITINARPVARISTSASAVCPDDSARLTADAGTGYQYRWQLNNTALTSTSAQIAARQPGTYQVIVTSPAGCTAASNQLPFTVYPRPNVKLDSIPPICGSGAAAITLTGQPGGGVYAGPGITGSRFDPKTVGTGNYKVTYTYTSAEGCRLTQSRTIIVSPGPTLSGATNYQITRGNSAQLLVAANEPIRSYRWEPPATLNRPDVADPMATPTETTPYRLTAVSANGCPASLSVLVEVIESMYIPNAFSPNADGLNDVWVLPNAPSFPRCEVSIYNRWGELIYYSLGYTSPWDGTYRQERVEAGVYTYQIRTGDGPLTTTYRGQLTVVR